MALEIEKRFLVRSLPPDVNDRTWQCLRQGYLAIDANSEVRVRDEDGRYSLTVKKGSGVAREEVDLPLEFAHFSRLWPLTTGRQLEKRRLCLPLGAARLYLDEYLTPASFLLAEVEFTSESDAAAFVPPAWFGPEVTDIATMSTFPALIRRVTEWQKNGV